MNKIYKCTCGCGGVVISTWDEAGEEYTYIEFLKRCRAGRGLRKRLHMIWKLLRYGYYYDDDIVLDKTTSMELGKELIKMSNNIKE